MDRASGILSLDDTRFELAWAGLSDEQRSAIGAQGFDRWRKLNPHVFRTVEGIRRAQERVEAAAGQNGHDIEPDSPQEPPEWLERYYGDMAPEATEPERHSNIVDWAELAKSEPPKFDWIWDHWLSWHPTGLWGRGGIGKSLLAQQIETACAIGRPLWGTSCAPISVLAWHCEDDRDEIWRRQDRICRKMGIGFDVLSNLKIDARCGMENALFATEYGRPMWTPLYNELKQQVNDYRAQFLVLDNIAQLFGGNLNDQHHVTTFVNGIIGLVKDRPFCPLLLGHVAKVAGSEFSGAMAWENAVRMRWYFAEKLPAEAGADQTDAETDDTETRFLCKRKTNYSQNDYVQFRFDEGTFQVQNAEDASRGGMMDSLRGQRAKTVVLHAVDRLAEMGVHGSDQKGANYLPSKLAEMKLSDGFTKAEIRTAMNALMLDGSLVRKQVGKYANRTPKFGLGKP